MPIEQIDLDNCTKIWEEPPLSEDNIQILLESYNQTSESIKANLIGLIKAMDAVRITAMLMQYNKSNPPITIGKDGERKTSQIFSDSHFVLYILKMTLKYGNFQNFNRMIDLTKFEEIYHQLCIDFQYSRALDFFDIAQNGFRQNKKVIEGRTMIRIQTNVHHALYANYCIRQKIHHNTEHPTVSAKILFKDLENEYAAYTSQIQTLYGCTIKDIAFLAEALITLIHDRFSSQTSIMNLFLNIDLNLQDVAFDEEIIEKIGRGNGFFKRLVMDVEDASENFFSDDYYQYPIIKKGNHYVTNASCLIEAIPEVIGGDLAKLDTKKYKGNPFELRVRKILTDKEIPFRHTQYKEFAKECEIDILFEDEHYLYILDCKNVFPSINYFYEPLMVKRAKSDYKKYEEMFRKKLSVLSRNQDYNPAGKPIKKLVVTFFPLYVSHYLDYLCLTAAEFIYWIDNYFLKKKSIISVNRFFQEFIEMIAPRQGIRLSPPTEDIRDISIGDLQ